KRGGESGPRTRQGKETPRQARHRAHARRRAGNGSRAEHAVIAVVLAASQLSQGTPAPALVVRDARRSIRVAIVATPAGPMLRPEALAPLLRVDVHHDSSSW